MTIGATIHVNQGNGYLTPPFHGNGFYAPFNGRGLYPPYTR